MDATSPSFPPGPRSRRRAPLLTALGVTLALGCAPDRAPATHRGAATAAPTRPGLARLTATPDNGERRLAIARFASAPTEAQLAALRARGIDAQGLRRLPMAIVRGTTSQLVAAVNQGAATDVYPDERLTYLWDQSNRTIKADTAQALGATGQGVQVAVVDSGIDGTHPDLADHVPHNVVLLGPEYANQHPDAPPGTLVFAADQGPYNNTDAHSGHGTHVAGIIAADGTTGPSQVGVAPDAELIGYAIGEVAFTTAVISAYDHILDHPEWGVDVVNNSWGSQWMYFDPEHPIHVATKAVADQGVVVVFAAGNSGDDATEMSLNPFSSAPWVISVASSTVSAQRSSFSSNGLVMDNSVAAPLGDGHVVHEGDRIGLFHPDVTAPGSSIVSSCPTGGTLVGPCTPGGTTTASGTSMASPQVAGVAALVRQARPDASPEQVRELLEATAAPLADGAPFWQIGYGLVDAAAAVALAQRDDGALRGAHAAASARVLADRDWQVVRSEFWTWPAPTATVEGVPDARTLEVEVPAGVDALKAAVAYPSGGAVGVNSADYTIVVKDAAGVEVAETTAAGGAGVSTVLVELQAHPDAQRGIWTLEVTGVLAVSDPDSIDNESLLGRTVTVQAATLRAQARVTPPTPEFLADGTLPLALSPEGATALVSPEGCLVEEGTARGGLAPPSPEGPCHTAPLSWTSNRVRSAEFLSAPLDEAWTFGGVGTIVAHLVDAPQPVTGAAFTGRLFYELAEVTADGTVRVLGAGDAIATEPVGDGRNEVTFELPPADVALGSSLRFRLGYSTSPAGAPTSTARLLYGGPTYGDSGVTLTFGRLVLPGGPPDAGVPDAGAPDAAPPMEDDTSGLFSCRVALPPASGLASVWALLAAAAVLLAAARRRR